MSAALCHHCFPPVTWSVVNPAIPLLIIGSVYLFSRFVYLPIPHLEFFRFMPAHKNYPYAVALGLTLPACTIPLVLILLAAATTLDNPPGSFAAGFFFGTMFSSITMVTATCGISTKGAVFLSGTAKFAPYFTAILLVCAAYYCFISTPL